LIPGLQNCRIVSRVGEMEKETQISAMVSVRTKELLERQVRATGVKKGHLVEAALRHHLQALLELPADVIVHPKVIVEPRSGAALARRLVSRPRPTAALRKLMSPGGD
jgi:hypothetical protein